MPGGYGGPNVPPMQQMPPPLREKRGGANGCLIGAAVGCGVLILLFVVLAVVGGKMLKSGAGSMGGLGGMVSKMAAAQAYIPKMREISKALDQYKADHDGKYPASLNALVPKYLSDKALFTPRKEEGLTLDYAPPKPNAAPDTIVISVTGGESEVLTSRTTLYYRLLKDGSLVQDQIQRVDISQKYGGKAKE